MSDPQGENPIQKAIPPARDPIAREFKEIMLQHDPKNPVSLDERLTATYLRALKPDVFEGFKYHRKPPAPKGWNEDYQDYLTTPARDKSETWKLLENHYSGYIKAKSIAASENEGFLNFLKDGFEHLTKVGALSQAEQYKTRLEEFAVEARLGY